MQIEKVFENLQIKHWGILKIDESTENLLKERETQVRLMMMDAPRNDLEPPVQDRFLFLDSSLRPVKYIVSIAIPYDAFGKAKAHAPGLVDNSAWGVDYHHVLKQKLIELNAAIEKISGEEKLTPEVCVDTSKYIDREIGLYTGLGKIGKNHFLIHPELGTQFFIGYLIYRESLNLTGMEMDISSSLYDGCKSCNLCVRACPAQICGFSEMDSEKCISSLTQTKRKLSDQERLRIGNRLYGCNICQLVCPSNHTAQPDIAFQNHGLNQIDPKEVLMMSNKMFKKRYSEMGFSWRPAWIYKRNALVVLGNTGNANDLKWLKVYGNKNLDEKLTEDWQWAIDRITQRVIYLK